MKNNHKAKVMIVFDPSNHHRWQLYTIMQNIQYFELVGIILLNYSRHKYSMSFNHDLKLIKGLRNVIDKTELNIFRLNISKDETTFTGELFSLIKDKDAQIILNFSTLNIYNLPTYSELTVLHYEMGTYKSQSILWSCVNEISMKNSTIDVKVVGRSPNVTGSEILAHGKAKITQHSIMKSMKKVEHVAVILLRKAIQKSYTTSQNGVLNGRTPSLSKRQKLISSAILLHMVPFKFISRIVYGSLIEKRWKVAITEQPLALEGNEFIQSEYSKKIPISDNFIFYADPFYSPDFQNIRLEALFKKDGIGCILDVKRDQLEQQKILLSGHHNSYPFSFTYKDSEYLMPEIGTHSNQKVFKFEPVLTEYAIKGLENRNIVDATLYYDTGIYFLFFGDIDYADNILELWYATTPFDTFYPHPLSPIVIDPKCARMGGSILQIDNKLIRFGQNNSATYGKSLNVMEITKISKEAYVEHQVGEIKVSGSKGPHTLNFNGKEKLFDFYDEVLSCTAGLTRLKALINRYNAMSEK